MHKITGEDFLDESCFNVKRCKLSNKNTWTKCSTSSFNCFIPLEWAEKVYLSKKGKPQRRTTHICMNHTYYSNPKTRSWLKWLTAACHGGGSRASQRQQDRAGGEGIKEARSKHWFQSQSSQIHQSGLFFFFYSKNKIDWFHSPYVSVY